MIFLVQDFRRNQNNHNHKINHKKNDVNKNLSINSKQNTTKDTYASNSKKNTLDKKIAKLKNKGNNNKLNEYNKNENNTDIENTQKTKIEKKNNINNKKKNINLEINVNENPVSPQDKSVFSSPSERIYIGKYVGGQKNGPGKLLLPNESEYDGNFKNNEFDGYGVYKTKTYNYYGYFTEGKKNGKGKLEDLINGSVYEGEFVNDKKEGYGEEQYKDGSVYKGEFKNGLKEGNGVLILIKKKTKDDNNINNNNNGNDEESVSCIYKGQFKNDQICGVGRFKFSNKKEYYGEWENNEIMGYGMLLDGKVRHFGYFSHNIKEGYGVSFYEDQYYALIGKWEENLLEGPSILVYLYKKCDTNNNYYYSNKPIIEKENIVGMYKGEIINMNLGEEDINTFKNSEDYQEMLDLYKNKFYPDYIKCINNAYKSDFEDKL